MGLIPCKDADEELNAIFFSAENVNQFTKQFALCLNVTDTKNYWVTGMLPELTHRTLKIGLYPCSLSDSSKCATKDEIYSLELYQGKTSISFDPSEYSTPIKRIPGFEERGLIDPSLVILKTSLLQMNEVWDSRYDLVPPTFIDSYISVYETVTAIKTRDPTVLTCTLQSIEDETCLLYLGLEIKASSSNLRIDREYNKVLATLGDIGGIFEILCFLAGIIYAYRKNMLYHEYMRKKLFQQDHEEYSKFVGKDKREVFKIMNSSIETQKDATDMLNRISSFKIIETIVMKPYHKALVPLFELKREKRKQEKIQNAKKDNRTLLAEGVKNAENHMSLEQAFKELQEAKGKGSQLEQLITQYFIEEINEEIVKIENAVIPVDKDSHGIQERNKQNSSFNQFSDIELDDFGEKNENENKKQQDQVAKLGYLNVEDRHSQKSIISLKKKKGKRVARRSLFKNNQPHNEEFKPPKNRKSSEK